MTNYELKARLASNPKLYSLRAQLLSLTEEEREAVLAPLSISPDDIELVMTCGACPEQYDAKYQGKQVGYLRLRHGMFRVDAPDCGKQTIYEANPIGDGCFMEDERDSYLKEARAAIAAWLEDHPEALNGADT